MELPIEYLKNQIADCWLLGYDCHEFIALAETLFEKINQALDNSATQKILLIETDPVRFLASFIAACSTHHQVFIGNPAWGASEWQQVLDLIQPDLVLGSCQIPNTPPQPSPPAGREDVLPPSLIMIPTGGSSGNIRFAMHSWQTLMASVQGFRQYFQVDRVNCICTLPLYHVSGLMQFMRSFSSGGKLAIAPFKNIISGQWLDFEPTEFFISLVPTQLSCLLEDIHLKTWLSQCRTVLLGGAPSWTDLVEKARFHQIPLAATYGMTETASQIVALKPEAFLSGNNSSGQVLPHAKVRILSQAGELLGFNQTGRITIQATSLALGYYPELFPDSENFITDDLGYLDCQGYLNIVGRNSDKIITGGENVFPSEVESAIRATNLVIDVSVVGITDKYWGQIVTAVYIPRAPSISSKEIQNALEGKLTRFKRPKLWVQVEKLPTNEQGKVNRKQLHQLVNTGYSLKE